MPAVQLDPCKYGRFKSVLRINANKRQCLILLGLYLFTHSETSPIASALRFLLQ